MYKIHVYLLTFHVPNFTCPDPIVYFLRPSKWRLVISSLFDKQIICESLCSPHTRNSVFNTRVSHFQKLSINRPPRAYRSSQVSWKLFWNGENNQTTHIHVHTNSTAVSSYYNLLSRNLMNTNSIQWLGYWLAARVQWNRNSTPTITRRLPGILLD